MKTRIIAIAVIAACGAAAQVGAQPYPNKTVRVIVPFAPGGERTHGRRLGAKLAGGLRAAGDDRQPARRRGHDRRRDRGEVRRPTATRWCSAHRRTMAVNPTSSATYRTTRARTSRRQLVARCRHPRGAPVGAGEERERVGRAGEGEAGRLTSARRRPGAAAPRDGYFRQLTRNRLIHVPYKGAGPALLDLMAGHVDMFFSGMPPALPHVK